MAKLTPFSIMPSGSMLGRYIFVRSGKENNVARLMKRRYPNLNFSVTKNMNPKRIYVTSKSGEEISQNMYMELSEFASRAAEAE